jgi:hypothetical protein
MNVNPERVARSGCLLGAKIGEDKAMLPDISPNRHGFSGAFPITGGWSPYAAEVGILASRRYGIFRQGRKRDKSNLGPAHHRAFTRG